MKKFSIPCYFNGVKSPFTIYIGAPEPAHHPLHFQADWLSKARGGTIPQEIMDSIQKLKDLADKNNVSFEELCVYALGTAAEEAVNTANTQEEPAQVPPPPPPAVKAAPPPPPAPKQPEPVTQPPAPTEAAVAVYSAPPASAASVQQMQYEPDLDIEEETATEEEIDFASMSDEELFEFYKREYGLTEVDTQTDEANRIPPPTAPSAADENVDLDEENRINAPRKPKKPDTENGGNPFNSGNFN